MSLLLTAPTHIGLVLIIVGVAALLILTVVYEVGLYREVHDPERQVFAEVSADPLIHGQPFHRMSVDKHGRLLAATGAMRLTLRNRGASPQPITGLRLEFRTGTPWYWPFSRLLLPPLIAPSQLQPVQEIRGRTYVAAHHQVDWQLPPASPTTDYHVFFQHIYPRDTPGPQIPKRRGYLAVFVIEVGAPDHEKRITLRGPQRPNVQP